MRKILIFSIIFFVIQLFAGIVIIYEISMVQTGRYVQQTAKRVKEDIIYNNGKWDTSAYNADPQLPGTYPLYILTTDGFVIERWKPLHGFLDLSDFNHLLTYQSPQTIHTITNQDWRIYSLPIQEGHATIGVITVSYFNPQTPLLDVTDQKIKMNAAYIAAHIIIQHGKIDTANLDTRKIPYDVAFQIVDQFNRILAKNNNNNSIDRIPNFIDASYVANALQTTGTLQVTDSQTQERFLLVSVPILDSHTLPVGVIVVGKSVSYIQGLLVSYLLWESIVGMISIGITMIIIKRIQKKDKYNVHKITSVKTITFNKIESVITINTVKIPIPYATNQYSLCAALFAAPKKRWEVDELLERFGENQEKGSWRKVYDAMIMINKKVRDIVDLKLIFIKNKTYSINPELRDKIR